MKDNDKNVFMALATPWIIILVILIDLFISFPLWKTFLLLTNKWDCSIGFLHFYLFIQFFHILKSSAIKTEIDYSKFSAVVIMPWILWLAAYLLQGML